MLEIFALPYFAISGVIIWAVFGPFFQANESDSLSCASLTISDLLAMPLPVSVVILTANCLIPQSISSIAIQAIVLVVALTFAVISLTLGLMLVPKKFGLSFLKRIVIGGIIAPFGILLTIGWIGFLIWACVYSISYFVPSMILIAIATFGLHALSVWICQVEQRA